MDLLARLSACERDRISYATPSRVRLSVHVLFNFMAIRLSPAPPSHPIFRHSYINFIHRTTGAQHSATTMLNRFFSLFPFSRSFRVISLHYITTHAFGTFGIHYKGMEGLRDRRHFYLVAHIPPPQSPGKKLI